MTHREPTTELADGEHGCIEGDARDLVVFGSYRKTGTYAPQLVTLIAERMLRGGPGTLIDVGANIGLVAIPVLERTRCSAILFEPEPHNHAFLRRNLARHGLDARCEPHALALDARAGKASLALCADNFGDHRFAHGPADERSVIEVQTARLDDVLGGRRLDAPVVLKIDCQGAEVRVLQGARKSLGHIDYAVVEYWPAGLLRMGDDAIALLQILLDFPYATLLLPGQPLRPLKSSRRLFEQLAWIPIDGSDEGFFDLVLSRHA